MFGDQDVLRCARGIANYYGECLKWYCTVLHLIRDGLLFVVLHLPQEEVLLVLRSTLLVHVRHFQALEVMSTRNAHT